eukprot:CAMPEP_0119156594 /NCGR_PEP_ID=MMETSP1310-20130426/52334_1 /TAXON_ID=464262 /ORGANISM="Genus nov. species nov., Strain RCC2339" /LENGTH=254 /DNA_ID=CAMNT_0007149209 /DNA_START=341 /DNA_END=1105 /DNA_ORIENTATION=+
MRTGMESRIPTTTIHLIENQKDEYTLKWQQVFEVDAPGSAANGTHILLINQQTTYNAVEEEVQPDAPSNVLFDQVTTWTTAGTRKADLWGRQEAVDAPSTTYFSLRFQVENYVFGHGYNDLAVLLDFTSPTFPALASTTLSSTLGRAYFTILDDTAQCSEGTFPYSLRRVSDISFAVVFHTSILPKKSLFWTSANFTSGVIHVGINPLREDPNKGLSNGLVFAIILAAIFISAVLSGGIYYVYKENTGGFESIN